MSILLFKIISIIVIFIAAFIGGIIPARVRPTVSGLRKLSLGNAFSGGVFLGAGLLHMLADSLHKFASFTNGAEYPLAFLTCGFGFLIILILEKGIMGGSEDIGELSTKTSASPYILALILSVHSLIAGASLGLENILLASLALLIAILAHKGVAAFALGVSLKTAGFSVRKHYGVIIFFALMTPLGIVLGAIFSTFFTGRTNLVFEGIFDALAAGTFLYIAVADILEEVFEEPQDRWLKIILSMAGFGLMAIIAIYT